MPRSVRFVPRRLCMKRCRADPTARCGLPGYCLRVSRHPGYPFEPRSTAYVTPGDFWAVPIRDGDGDRYCCGQVLTTSTRLGGSRMFTVGLLDWCDSGLPTAGSIDGTAVLQFGIAHVKTVRETGGSLLGNGRVPDVADLDDPSVTVWGYRFIERLAHRHFGGRGPA
jgi:hypothetical protein